MSVATTTNKNQVDVRGGHKGDIFYLLGKKWTVVGFVESGPAPIVAQVFLKGRGKYYRRAALRENGLLDAFDVNRTDLVQFPPETVVYPTFRGMLKPEPPAVVTPPDKVWITWESIKPISENTQYWDVHWILVSVCTDAGKAYQSLRRARGIEQKIPWERLGSAHWAKMPSTFDNGLCRAYRITESGVNEWTT